MISRSEVEKVWNKIDLKEIVSLAIEMGNIESPTGYESPMADFLLSWFKENGFEAFTQNVLPERKNVIGVVRGSSFGESLIFNSHIDSDIGIPGDPFYAMQSNSVKKAWQKEDKVFGKTVLNDRGPLACFLIAAKAIKEEGIILSGNLWLTAVVGEIGIAPIDEYQGPQYIGKGVGSRHLVEHGITADYTLVAETTGFGITSTEAGVVYYKITIYGEAIYTPRLVRLNDISKHPNAINKMAYVIEHLEKWAVEYEQRNTYELPEGKVIPKVNIGSIRGGLPCRPSKSCDECSIYIDVRLIPGCGHEKVEKELRKLFASLGIEAYIKPYLFRLGYEGNGVERLVEVTKNAYKEVFSEDPPAINTSETSMWRDINIFNSLGIPSITFGPPRRSDKEKYGSEKYFTYDDMLNTAKIYSLIALNIAK